jgi:hypothetical protein
LEIARWAIATLPSRVKGSGAYVPATAVAPSFWGYDENGCSLLLSENALRRPTDAAVSTILDIWVEGGAKVFALSWVECTPWMPPNIGLFKAGDWLYRLGWRH